MTQENVISAITKAGSVLLTTFSSFLIQPPSITNGDGEVIHWSTLLVFISGIFSIVLLGKKRPRETTKKLCFVLLGVLIFVIVTYELIYMNYTIECFGSRSVISHADVLPEVKSNDDYWKKQGPDALVNLVQAYQCNSIKIWAFTDLAIPYYSLLALYIAGLAVLTSLLLQTSNLIRQP